MGKTNVTLHFLLIIMPFACDKNIIQKFVTSGTRSFLNKNKSISQWNFKIFE